MNIIEANRSYESWLGKQIPLNKKDLQAKYRKMAGDSASFLRATFFRWSQIWPQLCPELATSPRVLAVGDLHVENFGTWRDSEGRLIWGINDFDEACPMPYTIDLVRLVTSYRVALPAGSNAGLKPKQACDKILQGYTDCLKAGGSPFVLAEKNEWLRAIALHNLQDPAAFCRALDEGVSPVDKSKVPAVALKALKHSLPSGAVVTKFAWRAAGKGSLGRPRYVALADYAGGEIVRESKALASSAWLWANPDGKPDDILYNKIISSAVRCIDPCVSVANKWITRRLAPDCIKIELGKLRQIPVESDLLYAMGWETANVHLGSRSAIKSIQKDLAKRPAEWLREASKIMADATEKDFAAWRKAHPVTQVPKKKTKKPAK